MISFNSREGKNKSWRVANGLGKPQQDCYRLFDNLVQDKKILKRALFLDRDGVINVDFGYVHKPEDFVFNEGIFDLCRAAVQRDFLIIVVTNQAGIGKGYYSSEDFYSLTAWMCDQFVRERAPITDVFHAPYYENSKYKRYRVGSGLRKPKPGMLLAAAKKYSIDLSKSIFVGDQASDISAGLSAGVGNVLLFNGSLEDGLLEGACEVSDLHQIVDLLSD